MKQIIQILILLLILIDSYAQTDVEWYKTYDSNISRLHNSKSYPKFDIKDDNITITGIINTPNCQQLASVNYDNNGNVVSDLILGSDSIKNNIIADYTYDKNNNVYLLHSQQIEHYKYKIILQKYSHNGELKWVKQIVDEADTSYSGYSMEIIHDSILIVNGFKEYDYPPEPTDALTTVTKLMLYAYKTNGSEYWQKEIGDEMGISYFSKSLYSINEKIVFFAFGLNYEDYIIYVEPDGNNFSKMTIEYPHAINNALWLDSDNLLVTSPTGRFELTKMDFNGKKVWSDYYETNLPSNVKADEAIGICVDYNKNIYITGRHYGNGYNTPEYTNGDILTIKYDSLGNRLWENRYEYKGKNGDIGTVVFVKNEYVYVGGYSQRNEGASDSDYVVMKLNGLTGKLHGVYRFNDELNGDDKITDIFVFENGKVAITGLVKTQNNYSWGTQLLTDIKTSVIKTNSSDDFKMYPNPIIADNSVLTISASNMEKYTIIDVNGKIITSGQLNSLCSSEIKLNNLLPGIFFVKVSNNKSFITKQLIKR